MNILQLCHRVPFPANDGGNIAMISLADSLISGGANLKMLTLNTKKHQVVMEDLPENVRTKYHIESVFIDTSVSGWKAFLNLFSSESYNVQRFYSAEFEKKLSGVLRSQPYKVVLLESLFMMPYLPAIRKNSDAKIILRAHNVEHLIWQRLATNEKNVLKRIYLSLLALRLRRYELLSLGNVDAILPVTNEDEKIFRSMGIRVPMRVTPVGIDTGNYAGPVDRNPALSLFHLGAMDWRPNLEGVEWFLDHCWNLIHEKFPALKLFLAGRGFPAHLMMRKDATLLCEGEITDAREFMSGKQIMIVPLKSGSGMRVKIIQGMAMGKTIISTTIGAEGIGYTDGKNILIADTPGEMLMQVEKCLGDKEFCFRIGSEAQTFVFENFSNERIGKSVLEFFRNI